MEIKLYNSLTKKMEVFKPINENILTMYVCGPTVYNHMHIGNGRPVVFFDTVRRLCIPVLCSSGKIPENITNEESKVKTSGVFNAKNSFHPSIIDTGRLDSKNGSYTLISCE